MRPLFITLLLLTVFAASFLPSASALRVTDNLHLTVAPDDRACLSIVLPDDAGVSSLERATYTVYSDAPWGDLKEGATFTTDENNTAIIPLCFSGSAGSKGNCSAHTITVRQLGAASPGRTYRGGVCISALADVDVAPLPVNPTNGSVADALNRNADPFALGFRTPLLTVQPNALVNLTLLLESAATAEYAIDLESVLSLAQTRFTTTTNQSAQKREFPLTTRAPATAGDYTLKATAIRSCAQQYCTKTATATLRVLPAGAAPAGFALSVFPERLDLAQLGPAFFEATVSSGSPVTVQLALTLPAGLSSTFTPTTLALGQGESRTVSFLVTPAAPKQLYELTLTATAGAQSRTASAVLSTQELATDAQRAIQALPAGAQPDAQRAYDSWYADYATDPVGTGDLAALSAAMARANATQPTPAPTPTPTRPPSSPTKPVDSTFNPLLLLPVAIAALVAAWLLLRKRTKKPAARTDPFGDLSA